MTKLKQYKREVDEGQYFLCNDIIFKSTFDKKEYLKKLLEEALDIRVIEVIDSSNTEMTVTSKRERRKVLDLIVKTNKGIINVEVNNNSGRKDTYVRNLIYFCKLLGRQLEPGENDFSKVEEHIQLNLTWGLNTFIHDNVDNEKKIEHYIINPNTGTKEFSKLFRIVSINMDYYDNLWYNKDEIGSENPFFMLLAAKSKKEMDIASKGDSTLEEINRKVEKLNKDPKTAKEIAEAIAVENEAEIWANTEHSRGLEEGLEQGRAEGITIGQSQGHAEGLAEGITIGQSQGETNKAIKIAKQMLNDGVDLNIITKYTGLTSKEIEELK